MAANQSLTPRDALFSLAGLMDEDRKIKFVFAIVDMLLGLLLLFFGLASSYWCTSLRLSCGSTTSGTGASPRVIRSGVGGIVIGFLGGTTLTIVILTSVATRRGTSLTPSALLATWLISGLAVAPLAGHFLFVSRLWTGSLGSLNLVLLLTALGGIHGVTIRAALLIVLTCFLTVPFMIPPKSRWPQLKRWLSNINTSLTGAMTFLVGVALLAPPPAASGSWVDLWTILFAPDGGASQMAIVQQWGTPAFKGYIAGAILLVLTGTAFEWYFHRHAGEDSDEEWNNYLGLYSGHLEKRLDSGEDGHFPTVPIVEYRGANFRAGMFEGPQSLWSRLKEHGRFRRRAPPAVYGAYRESAGGKVSASFEHRHLSAYTERQNSLRGLRRGASGRPARYFVHHPYDKETEAEDDMTTVHDSRLSDAGETEVDSEVDEDKSTDLKEPMQNKTLRAKRYLTRSDEDLGRSPSGLPRVPSYRSDSSSLLSGATAVDRRSGEQHRCWTMEKDSLSPPTVYTRSRADDYYYEQNRPQSQNDEVDAPPSLLDAIHRARRDQQQAKDLTASHEDVRE